MYRYTRHDFDRVLEFLRGACEPRTEQQFADYLLSAVPLLAPATYIVYGRVSVAPITVFLQTNPRKQQSDLSAITLAHLAANPSGKNLEPFITTGARLSDYQAVPQFLGSAIYNETYRRCGLLDNFTQMFQNDNTGQPDRFYGLLHEKLVPDSHADILMSLSPHLKQFFANVMAVEELETLRCGFDRLDKGALEIDSRGEIRFESPRVRRFLGEYFSHMNGRLPDAVSQWMSKSIASVRDATDLPAPRLPLIVERGKKRLIVRMFSDLERNLLTFEEQRTSVEPDALASLGLTKRESEILAYVALGKTNPEIATILQMRTRTVSKHLEHIFTKLGVETRTAAAAMAFESIHSHR